MDGVNFGKHESNALTIFLFVVLLLFFFFFDRVVFDPVARSI